VTAPDDARLAAARSWLAKAPAEFALDIDSLRPASADASFRRYFRLDAAAALGGSAILMDAPPDKEDTRPFLHVAQLLAQAGLNAPRALAQDVAQGFLLLTDLGSTTYLQALANPAGAAAAPRLFEDATAALLTWQRASRPDALPPYDAALLQRELSLFPDWYVARHLQHTLTSTQRQQLAGVERLLIDAALAQPKVYVHRDYMPRNLMVNPHNPGILDFQDAVYGPVTYDLVSLFRDAFISWEEEQVLDWSIRYWERARGTGVLGELGEDFAAFYRAFEWMGLQRHLKVLGIFARINYRDGKPHYLADTPRFVGYARSVAQRYSALKPLALLLDAMEGVAVRAGYTF
jgi:aminoglycoside/choline kinase family phosphotransferase